MELGHGEAHGRYHGHGVFLDPMAQFPSHESPLVFNSQVAAASLARPGEVVQVQNPAIQHNMAYCSEKQSVMIVWSHGGNQVAVTGSWDNWETVEPLWSLGRYFVMMKKLPLGVYHYRFIVDDTLTYSPELPWKLDDAGSAYNILELQVEVAASHQPVSNYASQFPLPNSYMYNCVAAQYIPETPNSHSEFDHPPSPFSSYDNKSINDNDFSKPPPDLPPQLQMSLLNEPSSFMACEQSLQPPQHTVLNHLYIQNNDAGLPVALGSTFRFRQKYVTFVLYKTSRR
ncbi:SNF1-related protein kinase regulatory subunit beta-2-like isoform X2 [Mangifera indica]|nr:SNF1-related protein kinase regulatory subunit beta-2-like isoform X2 [Mangifera indica]